MLESDSAKLTCQFDCFYLFEESEFTYKGGFVQLLSKIVGSESVVIIRDLDRQVDYLTDHNEISNMDWFDFYDKYNDLQNSVVFDNDGGWKFHFQGGTDSVVVACIKSAALELEKAIESSIDMFSEEKRIEVLKAVFLDNNRYQKYIITMQNSFPGIRNGLGDVLAT